MKSWKSLFTAILALFGIGLAVTPSSATPIVVPQDIVFLIDSSGSVGPSNFEIQREFIQQVYDTQIVGNGPSRTGLIQFATDVTTLHEFEDGQSPSVINDIVLNMPYTGGFTHTDDALATALDLFDVQSNQPSPMLMVLITDGNPFGRFGPRDVCQYANDIKSRDIETVIVGIGDNWDPNRVDCLVNDPSYIYFVDGFDLLGDFSQSQGFGSHFGLGYVEGVPVPGSLALLGFGLIGLGRLNRKAA